MKINKSFIVNNKFLFIGVAIVIIMLSTGSLFFYFKNKKLDDFSHAYTEYKNAEWESSVNSYVPMVDFSKDECTSSMCGKDNFYSSLNKALDFHASAESRVENSNLAILYYSKFNKKAVDAFSVSNGDLNTKVQKLIETANSITDEDNKKIALKIANEARLTQNDYDNLYSNEYDQFSARLSFLDDLIKNNGEIVNYSNLSDISSKVVNLKSKNDDLEQEITNYKKDIQDNFSALKGKTDLKEYPSKYGI